MEDRLEVNTLSKLIQKYFYTGPIGGASVRLAKIIRNHALGLPILSFNEVLDEYLTQYLGLNETTDKVIREANTLALKKERALFWKELNGAVTGPHLEGLVKYSKAKELYECVVTVLYP